MCRYRLLGPLEVRLDGRLVRLHAPKHRVLVATLLANAGEVVPTAHLAARIWGDAPPPGAIATVQSYVRRIRQAAGSPGFIVTRPNGYLIEAATHEVDVLHFRALVRRARESADAPEQAAVLREALALWRGRPLSDVPSELLHRELADSLLEERLDALGFRFEADLHRGLDGELVDELRAATDRHPLHEQFWSQLVLALLRSGKADEAARAYESISVRLAAELHVEPGAQLRAAHQELLGRRPVPHQLPAPTPNFVGRTEELATLDARTATVRVIDGTAGVGKTTLAVHWAHRAAGRFPDGQLYADLRGFAPAAEPTPLGDVVRRFLRALGVAADGMPSSVDEQIQLYHDLLSERRVLVVLDNARNAAQVEPLLPSTARCQVVITSRSRLTGLSAQPITLDLLDTDDAVALFTGFVGGDRVAAEPAAVADLVTGSAHLPLALSIVAAQASLNPRFPLRALADDLLGGLDADVQAVFSWSYARLSPAGARLFRLTGLHPGPALTAGAAASLLGCPREDVPALVTELVSAHLLAEPEPGRYASHDLLRAYAVGLVDPDEHASAVHRLLDHYLATSYAACRLLNPLRDELTRPSRVPGVTVDTCADHDEAWEWFSREESVLVGIMRLAASSGHDVHAWQLPWVAATYTARLARWHEFIAQQRTGLAAAERLGDLDAQARLHHMIGHASAELHAYTDAAAHLRSAKQLARQLGDLSGEARAERGLALISENREDWADALRHSREALSHYSAAGHRAGEAGTLNAVGMYLGKLGQHDEALAHCEQALALLQELGDRPGEANTWDSIGMVHHNLGDFPAAQAAYRTALDLFERVGERFEYAETLGRLGDALLAAGDRAEAKAAWRTAAELLADLSHPDAEKMRDKARSG